MANTITDIIPKILAQGVQVLRNQAVMPRLVNRAYDPNPGQKGSTVDVMIPPTVATRDVTPGVTNSAAADLTYETVPITLDKWREAPFTLTDKDLAEAAMGAVPMAVNSAVAGLAEYVNAQILANYVDIYGYAGVAATTPFASDYSEFTAARKVLGNQKAPTDNRFCVIDPDAEENAINLSSFADAGFTSENGVIREGVIGRKLGADWLMDQQVPTHTTGGGAGWLVNNASHAAGANTLAIDTGSGDPVAGDVFTVAGDTQTYVVTAYSGGVITHEPAGQAALADNAALTFKASHTANLLFHKNAFALASRPLLDVFKGGSEIMAFNDPVTCLSLRLEVSRQGRQTNWAFDVLFGTDTIRRELAARIAG